MDDTATQNVRMVEASHENYFVYHHATGKTIGRVWHAANGEWWSTFYLGPGEGSGSRNVSGGKSDSRLNAIAKVWRAHTT